MVANLIDHEELLDALLCRWGQTPHKLGSQCCVGVSFGWRGDDVLHLCGVLVVQLQDHMAELDVLAANTGQGELCLSLGEPHSWLLGSQWREPHGYSGYLCWQTVCGFHAESGSPMWDVDVSRDNHVKL
jgi:hypothetical protein